MKQIKKQHEKSYLIVFQKGRNWNVFKARFEALRVAKQFVALVLPDVYAEIHKVLFDQEGTIVKEFGPVWSREASFEGTPNTLRRKWFSRLPSPSSSRTKKLPKAA